MLSNKKSNQKIYGASLNTHCYVKQASLKILHNHLTLGKRQHYRNSKEDEWMVLKGIRKVGSDEEMKLRELLGLWNDTAWYCNGRCITIRIFQNLQNFTTQRRNFIEGKFKIPKRIRGPGEKFRLWQENWTALQIYEITSMKGVGKKALT